MGVAAWEGPGGGLGRGVAGWERLGRGLGRVGREGARFPSGGVHE